MKRIGLIALLAAAGAFGDASTGASHERIPGAFTWVRVEYASYGGQNEAWYIYEGRKWDRWETDFPEAEENFLIRMQELTTIQADPAPIALRLDDPAIMNYPFIYMSDVGWQELSDAECAALREYLLRGGFLWADDFWGTPELANFEFNMKRVFPEAKWVPIPKDHPIYSIVFPLTECPQVPARVFYQMTGQSWDPPMEHKGRGHDIADVMNVNFRGLFDPKGRLMAVMTHNTDLGDGWEREAEDPGYFQVFSVKAYAMALNIVVYALTH